MTRTALRRHAVGLALTLAALGAPLATLHAQSLQECTTTTVTTIYRVFGYEVYKSVEVTTECHPI